LTTNEGTSKFLKLDLQSTPIVINQSGVEWEEARVVQNDIYIMPGASLTISCRLVMADNARIVVRRGARLIVDGGFITSKGPTAKDCDEDNNAEFTRWRGIEVWGNTAVSTSSAMLSESYQLLSTDPGVVTLKNNAIIEHATVGIFPQQRGTTWEEQLQHFGGLISANNAEFRDCWKGVEYISNSPIRSSSQFVNTRFKQTYIGTVLPFPLETNFHGVSSWQVNDLTFSDCDFINLNTGITVLNADFRIEESLFQRNQRGIYIGATTPGLGLLTEIGDYSHGNIFESCNLPISVFAYDLAEIEDNTILSCPVGIYVEGPSGTIIQLNEFQNNTSNNNPALSTGIGLTQTGEGRRNLISCNEWTLTSSVLTRDGILVYGDNRSTLFYDNKFRCKYDVKIEQYDEDQTQVPGMPPDQFLGTSSLPFAVYNEFTGYTTPTHSNEIHTPDPFNPNGPLTYSFRYYHPSGTCPTGTPPVGGSEYIPRKPIHGTCVQSPSFNFINRSVNGSTSLNCTVPPRPDIVLDSECKTVQCLNNLFPQISQYKSVIDGGDVSSLYSGIQTSPNSTTTLNNLTAASPWLSDSVLQELLASSMTEGNKKSILSQNVPLPQHIMAQAQQTLSTQAYNYIVGLSTTSQMPARDSLQGKMISLIHYKDALIRPIVDSLVAAEEFSEADDLLSDDGGRFARETRIGLQILQGNLSAGKDMLNTWPDSETSDIEFANLMSMYFDYAIDGNLPSSTDYATLMDIASSSSNQSSRAKSLAGAFYGMLFDPLFPEEEMEGFSQPINPHPSAQINNELVPQFEVYPNPASDNIEVILNGEPDIKQKEDKTTICIYDTKGSIMIQQYLQTNKSSIDISSFMKGIYIITIYSGDQYLGVKRFLKQ
jgi:parallel beta-helix repeat protein